MAPQPSNLVKILVRNQIFEHLQGSWSLVYILSRRLQKAELLWKSINSQLCNQKLNAIFSDLKQLEKIHRNLVRNVIRFILGQVDWYAQISVVQCDTRFFLPLCSRQVFLSNFTDGSLGTWPSLLLWLHIPSALGVLCQILCMQPEGGGEIVRCV